MAKGRKIFITIFALLMVGGLSFYLTRPKEPTYEGKTLTRWLKEVINMGPRQSGEIRYYYSNSTNNPSLSAIKAIGTNGIPTLLSMMGSKDLSICEKLEHFFQRLGWHRFKITTSESKHHLACLGFQILGTNAQPAALELLRLLKTCRPGSEPDILYSLERIKPPKDIAIPELLPLLGATNNLFSYHFALSFIKLYPDEAEKAGVYKLYPSLRRFSKPTATNTLSPQCSRAQRNEVSTIAPNHSDDFTTGDITC